MSSYTNFSFTIQNNHAAIIGFVTWIYCSFISLHTKSLILNTFS